MQSGEGVTDADPASVGSSWINVSYEGLNRLKIVNVIIAVISVLLFVRSIVWLSVVGLLAHATVVGLAFVSWHTIRSMIATPSKASNA